MEDGHREGRMDEWREGRMERWMGTRVTQGIRIKSNETNQEEKNSWVTILWAIVVTTKTSSEEREWEPGSGKSKRISEL
jgi:hypothetical protein